MSDNDRVLLSGAAIEFRLMGTKAKLLSKSLNKQKMQNCKTSDGTAAQQSSKSPLLLRPAALAAILLLAAVLSSCGHSQSEMKEYNVEKATNLPNILTTVTIDSCEYLAGHSPDGDFGWVVTHKGNCKFCAARHSR